MDSDEHFEDEEFENPAELLDRLLRVSQVVRIRFNEWLARFDLNDGRHAVLVALTGKTDSCCSQAHLAERLGQSESNISTLIERMQRDGLVTRSKSDADRRKRVLQITSEGQSVLLSIDARRTAWAARLLNRIREKDRQRLNELLTILAESLESPREIVSEPTLRTTVESDMDFERTVDPIADPESPQSALRQVLQALSSYSGSGSHEKDVA